MFLPLKLNCLVGQGHSFDLLGLRAYFLVLLKLLRLLFTVHIDGNVFKLC